MATFTDDDPNGTASDYTATITWGDGNTSSGTISAKVGVGAAGVFTVSGTNTYAEEGTYAVSVTITETDADAHADERAAVNGHHRFRGHGSGRCLARHGRGGGGHRGTELHRRGGDVHRR